MADSKANTAGGRMKSTIVAILIVALLGFGLGIGGRMMFSPEIPAASEINLEASENDVEHDQRPSTDDKGQAEAEKASGADDATEPVEDLLADNLAELIATPLAPVITNLANPKTVWIRLESAILSRKDAEISPQVLATQAGHHVTAYLRTTDLRQIEGTNGLLHLTEVLNETLRTVSGGSIRQILIHGFIVE
jgi:flagellar protein FliL